MNHRKSYILVIVALAAAGYFVNIFIVISIAIVGKSALKTVIGNADLHNQLFACQMLGALCGGVLWGVIGDRHGRMRALFGSTLICAAASFFICFLDYIPNGYWENGQFIRDFSNRLTTYFILVFCVGFGLSGEIGADMTLVSEVMHDNKLKWHRVVATTFVIALGALGGLFAGHLSMQEGDIWKQTYYRGAGLSLFLVILRISVYGSNLFRQLKYDKPKVKRGDLQYLFFDKTMRRKLFTCCAIGLPTWFVLGVLLEKPSDFGHNTIEAGIPATIYLYSYTGLSMGSLVAGTAAYLLKSYRKPLMVFHILGFIAILFYIFPALNQGESNELFKFKCWFLGFGRGYWAIYVAILPTYFGTNLRTTASTISINTIRGLLALFMLLMWAATSIGIQEPFAAFFLAIVLIGTSFFTAVHFLEETYHRDLDFEDEPEKLEIRN